MDAKGEGETANENEEVIVSSSILVKKISEFTYNFVFGSHRSRH